MLFGARYDDLVRITAGYLKTNIPLISYKNSVIEQAITGDDIGLYILIPKFVKYFGFSVDTAILLFFGMLLTAAFVASSVGFFLLYRTFLTRFIAFSGISVLLIFSLFSDNYYTDVWIVNAPLFYVISALMLVPLFLYFFQKHKVLHLYLFMAYAGFLISFFSHLRAYSSYASLIFIIILLITAEKFYLKQKAILLGIMLFAMLLPTVYFNHQMYLHNNYLHEQKLPSRSISSQHVFWHTVYCGLGFLMLGNDDKIEFCDDWAVKKITPATLNTLNWHQDYELLVKNEVCKLFKYKKGFILRTIFAKIGILLLYLLIFANLGFLLAFWYRKSWKLELAFWCALGFGAVFPLVAVPTHTYTLSFVTFAALYGVISLNYVINQSNFRKINKQKIHNFIAEEIIL